MKKFIILLCVTAVGVLVAWASDAPVFSVSEYRNTGPIASFVAGTGTNTVLDIPYDRQYPFKLSEVTITKDSVASTNAVVYRVWNFQQRRYTSEVSTNLFDTVTTNSYFTGFVNVAQTNVAYKADDATPLKDVWFKQGDLMVIDAKETGSVVRVLGTF